MIEVDRDGAASIAADPAYAGARDDVDRGDLDSEAPLDDLQATILKGHGRAFGAHVLVEFAEGTTPATVARAVTALGITSAAEQQHAADLHRRDPGARTDPVRVVALSAKGLRALGYHEHELPAGDAFRQGMDARSGALGDGPATAWQPGWSTADLVAIVAHDSEAVLSAAVARLAGALPDATIQVEWGEVRRGRSGRTYEHFGFVDGISEPTFGPATLRRRPQSGVWWRPSFPMDQFVVSWRDRTGKREGPGSFMIFRKLQEHVERFGEAMAAEAERGGITAVEASSRVLGRDPDGTPRALTSPGWRNDFSYALDGDGTRCPITAHTRIVNPRTAAARQHMIARRGMPYRSADHQGEVGLLFIAYMADIERQFEWMQAQVNAAGDRIAGLREGRGEFVTVRGGQYFFVPPCSFFERLGAGEEPL